MTETQNVEYKETLKSGKIVEDISMFANWNGGEIWVGFKNDGTPAKQFIYSQESLDQFLNTLKDKIQPNITTISTELTEREGLTDGIILRVGKSHINYHTVNDTLWVRSGTIRMKASKDELELRRLSGKGLDYSKLVLTPQKVKPKISDLDDNAVKIFRDILVKNNPSLKDKSTRDLLVAEDLLIDENPNFVCFLFLGKYELRHQFLPPDIGYLHYLYEDEKNNQEERFDVEAPWIINLPKLFVEINKRNSTIQDIDLFRPNEKQYDEKAIEEAVINSIAHRNWLIQSWIEIIHTPERLRIFNPGIFKPDFSEVLREDRNYTYENPHMSLFLKKIDLMERERKGIKKKIYKAQIAKGLTIEMNQQASNGNSIERVEFIMNGKIKSIEFAKIAYKYAPELNFEQLQILDRIASGENIYGTDISEYEYSLIQPFVSKGKGRSQILKLKNTIFKENTPPLEDASMTSIESLILDYAKEKSKDLVKDFTAKDIYQRLGTNKNTIYAILSKMSFDGGNQILIKPKYGSYQFNKNYKAK